MEDGLIEVVVARVVGAKAEVAITAGLVVVVARGGHSAKQIRDGEGGEVGTRVRGGIGNDLLCAVVAAFKGGDLATGFESVRVRALDEPRPQQLAGPAWLVGAQRVGTHEEVVRRAVEE